LKPSNAEEDLAKTGKEFQNLIFRAKTQPTMYSADCLGELILNILSKRENTKESKR
jgi:hypothetical protein